MNITTDNTFEEIEEAIYGVPYPEGHTKPRIASFGNTPAGLRFYADKLEEYENYMVTYQNQVAKYWDDRKRLETIWSEKLRSEYSHLNDATFNACYDKAFDDEHSNGYRAVHECMYDIADFAEKIIAANK